MASYRNNVGGAGIIASAPRGADAGGVIASAPRGSTLGNASLYTYGKYGAGLDGAEGAARGCYSTAGVYGSVGGYTRYRGEGQRIGSSLAHSYTNRGATLTQGYSNSGVGGGVRTGRSSSIPVTTRRTKTPTSGYRGAEADTPTKNAVAAAGGYTAAYSGRASTPGRVRNTTSYSSLYYAGGVPRPLRAERVTLVLDLDETLVHSSFEVVPADLHIPLVMDGEQYVAHVKKRPHVDAFLAKCVELFDVIVWTASLSIYAEPLINELSRQARCGNLKKMYREHCTQIPSGGYVKDLTIIGRGLDDVCIVDNSPAVAQYQPTNLIPIVSWYEDPSDTALLDMIPFLEKLAKCQTVYDVIPTLGSYGLGAGLNH